MPRRDNPFIASARGPVRHLSIPSLFHDVFQEIVIVHFKRILENSVLANDTFIEAGVRGGLLDVLRQDLCFLKLGQPLGHARTELDFSPIRKDQFLAIFHGSRKLDIIRLLRSQYMSMLSPLPSRSAALQYASDSL